MGPLTEPEYQATRQRCPTEGCSLSAVSVIAQRSIWPRRRHIFMEAGLPFLRGTSRGEPLGKEWARPFATTRAEGGRGSLA
jgi:hypothetical protein